MARKASSRKPTLALPKPFARSPTARGKPARGLSAPEAADAAQQGLLQLAFAIILLMQQSLPEALVPWVYPLTVAGIPLTIISMGMTWQGLGLRKVGSFAAALVMPILMFFLVLGGARITDPSGAPDLGGIRLFVLPFLIGAL